MRSRKRSNGKSVLGVELLLVHHGHFLETRLGVEPQGRIYEDRRRDLVVLHAYHNQLVHSQLGRLFDRRTDDHAHRERRGFGQAKGYFVRNAQRRIDHDFLQGLKNRRLHEDVEVYGESPPQRVRQQLRRRHQSG